MKNLVAVSMPHPGVSLLQFNSPESRNALTVEMRQAISREVEAADHNESVRCIVMTGTDKAFSAGADVAAVADASPMDIARAGVERYWLPLRHCTKPIIAAVNGYALGGGCELAMLADIIVAGEGAVFGQPEVQLGIIPGSGATQRLPRVAGKYRAMKALLTGSPFSAREAQQMGLVSDLVEDGEVLNVALETAAQIAGHPPDAVRRIKEVVLAGADVPLDAGLLLERQAMQLLFDTEEQAQRMRAFVEARKPPPREA